jgi:CubicO group peptidase (beta-lactamase class C family)
MVFPLVFEPGEGWTYGVSIDWAGKAVERVNNNIRLGEYMQTHIWGPLGMTRSAFNLPANDVVRENLVELTMRTPDGLKVIPHMLGHTAPQDDVGGGGLFSAPSDYIKVLISLLRNDGVLLKPETVNQMFEPQLPDPKYLQAVMTVPEVSAGFGHGLGDGKEWNWGLGGILSMSPTPGRRAKGTLSWGGLPNLTWVKKTFRRC